MRSFSVMLATTAICTAAQAATITSEIKIFANDGAAGDYFASSTAISNGTVIVGAWSDDDSGYSSGTAYLFDANAGTQSAKLTEADPSAGKQFGGSVAISGNTAVVGAKYDQENGIGSGAAYVFDTTTKTQLHKLTANDAAATEEFGTSVAVSGNTAIVGAYRDDIGGNHSGSAYLFDTTTGSQLAKLTIDDSAAYDHLGLSVAISDNRAIVGAPGRDINGTDTGAAYLFDTTTGALISTFAADDGDDYDSFGGAVAISGNRLIVGAHRDADNGARSGSAYLYDLDTGAQIAKLSASDAAAYANFGLSVAISGDYALVGANGAGVGSSGAAYLFDVNTGLEILKVTASDAASGASFGGSVAIDGDTLLIGSSRASDNGSAYIYTIETAAVPLPAGVWLLGSALGALALRRRGRG